MSRGIDYSGVGATCNRDESTGIRYGIIPQNAILQAWDDSSEPDYGEPHCGKCGNEVEPFRNGENAAVDDTSFVCTSCKIICNDDWISDGDEPLSFKLDDGEYCAASDSEGDVWIYHAPYYTRAQFCSPCAPGACYLTNPCDDGERAYCFGANWFDDENPCPYPIYNVSDDVCVYRPDVEDLSDGTM